MKKALLSSTLARIIVVIILAGILILAMAQFSDLFGGQVNEKTCAASVALRSAPNIAGEAAKFKIPLRCKTNYLCLSMGGKCIEGYTKIDVKTEEDIKKQIADSMYSCWKTLGEGKLEFLRGDGCVRCAVIDFDDKVKQKYPVIEGANDYMLRTPIPGTNITYAEYLSQEQKDKIIQTKISKENDRMSTSIPYAVSYVYLSVNKWEQLYPVFAYVGIEAGLGIITYFCPPCGSVTGPLMIYTTEVTALTGFTKVAYDMITLKKCYYSPCPSLLLSPFNSALGEVCKDLKSIP